MGTGESPYAVPQGWGAMPSIGQLAGSGYLGQAQSDISCGDWGTVTTSGTIGPYTTGYQLESASRAMYEQMQQVYTAPNFKTVEDVVEAEVRKLKGMF